MTYNIKHNTMTASTSHPVLATLLAMILFASCVHVDVPDNASYNLGKKDLAAYTLGGASLQQKIADIDIEWLDGDVVIEYYDGAEVQFSETADKPLDSLTTLCYRVDGSQLAICYGKGRDLKKGKASDLSKKLLIRLPQGISLGDVSVEGVNTHLDMHDIVCQDIEVDGVDMQVCLAGVTCEDIDGDGVDMSIDLSDVCCKSINADGMNAHIQASLTQLPKEISADGINASVSLVVPPSAGFTIDMEGLSQNFSSELPVSHKDGDAVIGDGSCDVSLDGMNCTLDIKTRK